MEARPRDRHPETRKEPGTTIVLSARKSFRHDYKVFEKIILARILSEVSGRWLFRGEQFGFSPKYSISLKLLHLERVSRNLGEKRLINAVFILCGQNIRHRMG
jgi:hypothetical protein